VIVLAEVELVDTEKEPKVALVVDRSSLPTVVVKPFAFPKESVFVATPGVAVSATVPWLMVKVPL
jgi:hypothetical protein